MGQDDVTAEEEETIPAAKVQPLEEFEIRSVTDRLHDFVEDLHGAAAAAKENGNKLFKLKDYDAAAQLYGCAIDELRRFRTPKAGAECWVLMNHGGGLVLGSVRNVDAETAKADVALYCLDEEQLFLYRGAPWRVLIPVHEDHLALHSSLYTNRAKSLVQLGRHQEAAQDLTVTIGLWAARDEGARRGGGKLARQLSSSEVAEQKEQLTKAYYLRAKTRLSRLKLDPARRDLNEAKSLQPTGPITGLLQQLERDIHLAHKDQVRSNKCIAKAVAKWADQAMTNLDTSALAALDANSGGAAKCYEKTTEEIVSL